MHSIKGLRTAAGLLAIMLMTGCGGGNFRPVSDNPVRIGPPYRVSGKVYTPAADPTYDMLGYASWYGNESGNRTANGERFRAKWVTAAHSTLPLPSYVEVTALTSGRRIVVRVNDRGPFAGRGRIIDLSRGAAEELGVRAQGHVPVRIRVVNLPEKDKARLRKGKSASSLPPERPATLVNLRAQLQATGY